VAHSPSKKWAYQATTLAYCLSNNWASASKTKQLGYCMERIDLIAPKWKFWSITNDEATGGTGLLARINDIQVYWPPK